MGLILPTALLETRGARTGVPRRNAVIYFHDSNKVTIVASKLGAATHPDWYYNLRKNPDVTFGNEPFRAVAIDDDNERTRLWELADRVYPPYRQYRTQAAKAGREIPIVQLLPR
jgi:deazaflavin-dependent oxidoreductase (nitroreductase family)